MNGIQRLTELNSVQSEKYPPTLCGPNAFWSVVLFLPPAFHFFPPTISEIRMSNFPVRYTKRPHCISIFRRANSGTCLKATRWLNITTGTADNGTIFLFHLLIKCILKHLLCFLSTCKNTRHISKIFYLEDDSVNGCKAASPCRKIQTHRWNMLPPS
jgi:hypothetical protein